MKVLAALQGLTPSPAHCPGIVVAVGGEGEAGGPEPGDLHLGGRVGGLQPVVTLLGVAKPQPEPALHAPVALQRVQGGVERLLDIFITTYIQRYSLFRVQKQKQLFNESNSK